MTGIRARGKAIRQFILEHVGSNPNTITALTSKKFGVTRQTIGSNHIARLVEQGELVAEGKTRNRRYRLAEDKKTFSFPLDGLGEDRVWREDIAPNMPDMPDNAGEIWGYGFTEMLNNAIDHSDGKAVKISLYRTPVSCRILILDDGVGIFRQIQQKLQLEDESHAVLELSKGKLTTDPERHTGEGIFFSSRLFDEFFILSGDMFFSHQDNRSEDWLLTGEPEQGTCVSMTLQNAASRTLKEVFDEFTSDEDYGFNKTVISVSLAVYGNESLVSRSQAKRLLARTDRFKTVVFDFDGIEKIGQAFADEMFRVFRNAHPDISVLSINTKPEVQRFIGRAMANT